MADFQWNVLSCLTLDKLLKFSEPQIFIFKERIITSHSEGWEEDKTLVVGLP